MSVAGRLRNMRQRGPRVQTDPAVRAFRAERRRARLKVIPTLFTLGNLVCGFAAIVQVATIRFGVPEGGGAPTILSPDNLVHAAWLILLAMVFDAIDGRVARMTATTGDFGGELDSLCDAVSFGVAPGIMVAMANAKAISSPLFANISWLFGLAFACGAVLRLARFNVENSHDEEAHQSFKGLPSPAAAATIVATFLFQGFLRQHGFAAAANAISYVVPFLALAAGYLMVSKLRYSHVANRYLRGRKSVRKIAQIFFVGVIACAVPEVVITLAAVGFAASGVVVAVIEHLRSVAGASSTILPAPALAGNVTIPPCPMTTTTPPVPGVSGVSGEAKPVAVPATAGTATGPACPPPT